MKTNKNLELLVGNAEACVKKILDNYINNAKKLSKELKVKITSSEGVKKIDEYLRNYCMRRRTKRIYETSDLIDEFHKSLERGEYYKAYSITKILHNLAHKYGSEELRVPISVIRGNIEPYVKYYDNRD